MSFVFEDIRPAVRAASWEGKLTFALFDLGHGRDVVLGVLEGSL
jgi:hypothetical protein